MLQPARRGESWQDAGSHERVRKPGQHMRRSSEEPATREVANRAVPTGHGPQARVGRGFIVLYMLAYTGTSLLFLAPLLVSLALKVNDLVGIVNAPGKLAMVTSIGAMLSIVANPFFGRLSDRTTSQWGMRRPWLLLGLVGGGAGIGTVAVAPNIGVVLLGWCCAQVFFNAVLAALVAVMPDHVPVDQRGLISGVLAVCLPLASVLGTYLVQIFDQNVLTMLLVPCAVGVSLVLVFTLSLQDRRLDAGDRPPWSLRELAGTFYVNPRTHPDFAWAFASRFFLFMGYAFLVTYQAYYLIRQLGSSEDDVPHQIYLATLAQSSALIVAAVLMGRLSDRTGRRKPFVLMAAVIYGLALFIIATADSVQAYLLGMALGGVGFGMYTAVDLALVVDVLPDRSQAAKDLGVLNIAAAVPFSLAPAIAPLMLNLGDGSYRVLFVIAGTCALIGAAAITPVRGVR